MLQKSLSLFTGTPPGIFKNIPRHALRIALLLGLIAVLGGLCGCRRLSLGGRAGYADMESFENNPPRTIALMPTTDASGHPDLAEPMRKALERALAPLPYQDRQEDAVNEFLSRTAARLGCGPTQLPPAAMVDPQLADCVVFSDIERISRVYLFLYAHYRLDLNFAMWDARTRRIIYQNKFVFYDRAWVPTFDIMGLFGSSILSLWHLRPSQLQETLDEGAQKIVKELPTPKLELARNGNVELSEAQVVTPFQVLTVGSQVNVYVKGTPHCKVTFSIGRVARDIPLQEETMGRYHGVYKVVAGTDLGYAVVEVHMALPDGSQKLDYTVEKAPFAIDTQAPPRARVARSWPANLRPGIYLGLELEAEDTTHNRELPDDYVIYRQVAGTAKFDEIGVSHDKVFYDATNDPNKNYEYYIVTRDRAGNCSQVGPITLITPQAR